MNMKKIAMAIVKLFVSILLLLLLAHVVVLRACCSAPQPGDVEHMRMLKEKFPEYEFAFDCDMYISAMAKTKQVEEKTVQENIEQMYMCFFFDDSGERRKTWFVYLNYYNSNNVFQYQVHYNEKDKDFDRSLQPHY